MSNTVFCKKYQKDLPAMTIPPMPGPKGKEIMETVSLEAWEDWKSHQTTLINEKHLDLSNNLIVAFRHLIFPNSSLRYL